MSEAEYLLGGRCGVTLAGIKPASLISVSNRTAAPFYRLCKRFRSRGVCTRVMRLLSDRVLFYVYTKKGMQQVLTDPKVSAFLRNLGYSSDPEEAISDLKLRMQQQEFPHEIGIFLGYPLEDVEGFMRDPHRGVQLNGYWKVYRDPQKKAKTFAAYKRCSACICDKMRRGKSLTEIFGVAENES